MNDLPPSAPFESTPAWALWKNPLMLRFIRSRMRPRTAFAWILGVLMLSGFFFLTTYYTAINHGLLSARDAARAAVLPILFLQGLLLMLIATGSVAGGVVEDKVAGTLDYQRLTPMGPFATLVGFLFGLPIREYVLFALTLPFSVFAIWVGKIPVGSAAAYYGVFLSASILYHLTGLAAGLAAKRWRFATRLTQGMVLLLYLVLPQFSHLGLYFFQYLTVRPVLMNTIIPLVHESMPAQASELHPRGPVPFFDLEVSPLVFSLILQGLLSLMFLTICVRKWRDAECHVLSKAQSLTVFVLLATLALGTIWPVITGNTELTLPILGTMSGARIPPEVAATLPLLLSCFLLLSAMVLISIATPTHGEILRGWRHTYQKNRWLLSPMRDEAPSGWFALAIAFVAALALTTEMRALHLNGILAFELLDWTQWIGIPLALVVPILVFHATISLIEPGRTATYLMLVWGLPCLIGIFVSAALSWHETAIYIGALSPVSHLLYAATRIIPFDPESHPLAFWNTTGRALWIGLSLHTLSWFAISFAFFRKHHRLKKQAKN